MSEFNAQPLSEFEARLRALRPCAPSFDRDRFYFEAGRRVAGARRWQASTAVLSLLCVGMVANWLWPRPAWHGTPTAAREQMATLRVADDLAPREAAPAAVSATVAADMTAPNDADGLPNYLQLQQQMIAELARPPALPSPSSRRSPTLNHIQAFPQARPFTWIEWYQQTQVGGL